LPALETYLPAATELLKNKPLAMGVFSDLFKTKTGLSDARMRSFKTWATNGETPVLDCFEKRSRGVREKLIGTPEQIRRLKEKRDYEE